MAAEKSSEILISIGFNDYKELYADWINNFVSTEGFASHYGIDQTDAKELIENAVWLYGSKEKIKTIRGK